MGPDQIAIQGFWGDGFFQSDRDVDILEFFDAELGTESIYVQMHNEPEKLRPQLDANNKLINKIAEVASGARDNNEHIAFWGRKLVIVILAAAAMQCGAKLPEPLRQAVYDALKSRLGMYDRAKEQMRRALAVYADGTPLKMEGMGLIDTIHLHNLIPIKRHPDQIGVNFPNPVFSAKYETAEDEEICAKCSKKEGVKLKTCAKCLRIKYCSSECQREHWTEHKKECKKDGLPRKVSPVNLQTYGVRPSNSDPCGLEPYVISEHSPQSPAPKKEK
ncbi:putative egl nine 1 protein [Lasiodiplodia theobromae]|uniref:SET domain-containing protein 14 n=1 Tax=Lasiodiplodia theobromae TaxID=45133 RepID=A0A5N5D073_9PEZI|nr:SET domain-containing protein 14 [Lasiodiplodia theobromae]KAF9641626.1 putative egl nine 1 protein [Lasiodiplodia theobromae]